MRGKDLSGKSKRKELKIGFKILYKKSNLNPRLLKKFRKFRIITVSEY
ncbi:hypothetical protein LEP1GSC185_3422 [Leptospira licerasiae serovar Varillal str. VAR 010]|nr:hypothetical protein LEP1GSC185_3422 [Leptospira licerasiae serovar Varillal str. VAR 010]